MIIPIEAETLSKDNSEQTESSTTVTGQHEPPLTNNTSTAYFTSSGQGKVSRSGIKYVLGLVYLQETLPSCESEPRKIGVQEIAIGTIILTDHRIINANQLRQLIIQQSLFNLDNNYIFLTNFGSPILISQEAAVELKHLINGQNNIRFKRNHSPFRCAIIAKYPNGHSAFVDYVISTYDTNLKTLRVKIDEVLREPAHTSAPVSSNSVQMRHGSFLFVHSLCYTIHRHNESTILLVDILQSNCVFVRFDHAYSHPPLEAYTSGSQYPALKDTKYSSNDDFVTSTAMTEDQADFAKHVKPKKASILRRKTFKLQKPLKPTVGKQIMISYVRQEAAEHAMGLKNQLLVLGYSVYLDVHEIQKGSDWQDSLNYAVQNCNFFVPLITRMYGKTQWTNREVKLADLKGKHIIPINFLDYWPPECLAIQFATTQYITWDPESLQQVSKLIGDEIAKFSKRERISRTASSLSSPTASGSVENLPTTELNNGPSEKPLIVISAHPNQYLISKTIKDILSPNYQVWCSNNLNEMTNHKIQEQPDNYRDSFYDSNLSPIIEENPTLTHATQDYARKIAENSKQRPKSVPNHENSEFKLEIKKRDLARVSSLNGEVSYLSSISPDKMERLKNFQQQVISSALVIVIASKQYYKSRTSEQHVYYCGQRKKTILVQCDKSPAPVWFSKLTSQDKPLNYDCKDFKQDLINKINRVLDPSCKYMEDPEVKIKYLSDCMKKNLPNLETCVYVFGSTELGDNPRNTDICKAIGKELAKVSNINIVTNGFFGTGDLVAHTFVLERKALCKESDNSVVHIVPIKDSKNYNNKCRQDQENMFEKVDYGKTYFLGESVRERDSVIARMLDTCLLIGGNKDAAHEIEEFIWNDHFVIPVRSTGGAAAGEFDVPQKIFTCPSGVRQNEWDILSKPDATPDEVAKAVVHIICDLKKAIHKHTFSNNVKATVKKSNSEKPIKKRIAKRKRLNIDTNQTVVNVEGEVIVDNKTNEPASPEKVLPTFLPDTESVAPLPEPSKGLKGNRAQEQQSNLHSWQSGHTECVPN